MVSHPLLTPAILLGGERLQEGFAAGAVCFQAMFLSLSVGLMVSTFWEEAGTCLLGRMGVMAALAVGRPIFGARLPATAVWEWLDRLADLVWLGTAMSLARNRRGASGVGPRVLVVPGDLACAGVGCVVGGMVADGTDLARGSRNGAPRGFGTPARLVSTSCSPARSSESACMARPGSVCVAGLADAGTPTGGMTGDWNSDSQVCSDCRHPPCTPVGG